MMHRLWLLAMIVLVTWFGHSYGGTPAEITVEDRVDVIERNNFYDWDGKLVFIQHIFWDWSDTEKRFRVRDWRMVKTVDQTVLPHKQGGYYVLWRDPSGKEPMRMIRSKSYLETWEQYDVEVEQREILPKEQRLELAKR